MSKPSAVRNLCGHVMSEIGRRIVSGAVQPGEILPREELLAESLHVSRTALREAMKVLSSKGLIESRSGVGARVQEVNRWNLLDADVLAWRCASIPSDAFADKLAEMREIIEPAAAGLAAQRRTARQLKEIEIAYEQMAAARTREAWVDADLRFHETILQSTENELLSALFSVVDSALEVFFALSASSAGDFAYSLPHHHRVLIAIRRKKTDEAREAMFAIIADSRSNLRQSRLRAGRRTST